MGQVWWVDSSDYRSVICFEAADLLCFDAGSRFISFDFLAHRGMLCQVELIDRTLLFVKFMQQGKSLSFLYTKLNGWRVPQLT